MSSVSSAMNEFALSLYNEASNGKDGENLFFSPLSIYTALSMVYAGAAQSTAVQMKACMKTPYDSTDVNAHKWLSEIWNEMTSKNSTITLNLANKLWLQKHYTIKENYSNILKQYYSVESELADFAKDPEKIRENINKWVEEKTNEKIKDLIPMGSLNGLTRLVLVNAVYFNGDWQHPFKMEHNIKMKFHSARDEKEVETMFLKKNLRYFESKNYDSKLLSLPYKDSKTSLVIVLPNKKDGLKSLEEKMAKEKNFEELFTETLVRNNQQETEVFLPKFKFDASLSLKEHLEKMGMTDLFSMNKSNLSGMSEMNDLFVSDAFHKAFIDVNEKGTEAAAATGMIMMTRCMMVPKPPKKFKADHPFLFFVYDEATKATLFMGRIANL